MENIVNNKISESLISNILLFFAATIMFWIECGYSILYHANYFIAGYLILFSYASLFVCFLKYGKLGDGFIVFLYLFPMIAIATQISYNIR